MAAKRRLDAEMVRRGIVDSREAARREIQARNVLVDGSFADKPARMVAPGQNITLNGPPPRFVGRGGHKLEGALASFAIDPTGARCLDAGSSTGGFTDCLLQHGAAAVVAVDVGTNQLHERLRADERVMVREQTDVRRIRADHIGGSVDLIVGDLSFISLRLVLPPLAALLAEGGELVLLVKPQFEAGRQEVSKGKGVISDPAIWLRVLREFVGWVDDAGLCLLGIAPSPITGSSGNVEFVTHLGQGSTMREDAAVETETDIESAVAAAAEATGREMPSTAEMPTERSAGDR